MPNPEDNIDPAISRMIEGFLERKVDEARSGSACTFTVNLPPKVDIEEILSAAQLRDIYEQARVNLWKAWARTFDFDFDRGDILYLPRGHKAKNCVPEALTQLIRENDFILDPIFIRNPDA